MDPDADWPSVIKTVDTPGAAMNFWVTGDKMYVADAWGGIQVVDINPPADAAIIDSLSTKSSIFNVEIDGSWEYLYACGLLPGEGGLYIYELY